MSIGPDWVPLLPRDGVGSVVFEPATPRARPAPWQKPGRPTCQPVTTRPGGIRTRAPADRAGGSIPRRRGTAGDVVRRGPLCAQGAARAARPGDDLLGGRGRARASAPAGYLDGRWHRLAGVGARRYMPKCWRLAVESGRGRDPPLLDARSLGSRLQRPHQLRPCPTWLREVGRSLGRRFFSRGDPQSGSPACAS